MMVVDNDLNIVPSNKRYHIVKSVCSLSGGSSCIPIWRFKKSFHHHRWLLKKFMRILSILLLWLILIIFIGYNNGIGPVLRSLLTHQWCIRSRVTWYGDAGTAIVNVTFEELWILSYIHAWVFLGGFIVLVAARGRKLLLEYYAFLLEESHCRALAERAGSRVRVGVLNGM